jgi:hypothetical protein
MITGKHQNITANTFKSIRSAINRPLQEIGHLFDKVRDREFKACNNIIDGKRQTNLHSGISRTTKGTKI